MLMFMLLLGTVSFAATTKPLSNPQGLALDSQGNLWVANYSGNEVLVYNPSYIQLTGKTITNSLNGPTGVAFDPSGNLWVSNINTSTVNEYSSTGKLLQQLSAPGLSFPIAISIDGIGNLWVQSSNNLVQMYALPLFNQLFNSATASSVNVGYFLGIATQGSQWAIGTDQGFELSPIDLFLQVNDTEEHPVAGLNGNSLAFDKVGNLYVGNLNGSVDYYNVSTKTYTSFATLGYPKGMVVDNARKRVYISDFTNSVIQVYSTSGTLLQTIH
jgi:sugar lactone lactonase YvrE